MKIRDPKRYQETMDEIREVRKADEREYEKEGVMEKLRDAESVNE